MAPKTTKRLFLVDAMGYIFRAFFAPMDRLQTSTGIPTKVPYLFATMMRRLLQSKDLRPDYVAVVFDVAGAHLSRQAFRRLQSAAPADAGRPRGANPVRPALLRGHAAIHSRISRL